MSKIQLNFGEFGGEVVEMSNLTIVQEVSSSPLSATLDPEKDYICVQAIPTGGWAGNIIGIAVIHKNNMIFSQNGPYGTFSYDTNTHVITSSATQGMYAKLYEIVYQ